ncbi:hypothetical protein CL620_04945 [archaeon]|jgi:CRISPR/Cas system-associated exonuclease Cas4 (RecB family)|nr:hypothetical protein [archaeon]|tara:strand:- start:682 stop:1431 length:750 start_codon:yes stop_codon:yes gene_type:complete
MRSLDKLRGKSKPEVEKIAPPDGDSLSESLVEAIDCHLGRRNSVELKRVDGFHPSYTNQCARYWVYLLRGVESKTDFAPQTYRIFDNGHAVHDRIYSYLSDMGILLKEEIPVENDDPPISGTADGVIEFYGEKLIELKSISDAGFAYRKTYNKPKDDHIRQAQIYMHCLNLNSGFVIYENKNNQEILPIYMERNDEYIDKLFKKYRKIYAAFLDERLPLRPYKSKESKQCLYCNARDFCWGDQDGGERI